jgi:hypothetical protein
MVGDAKGTSQKIGHAHHKLQKQKRRAIGPALYFCH